ncbi:hypothetical protein ACU5P1_08520 [Pseudomonas plecoglossicida]|uniref:hypothetical protein n=1 Tax=Pseudomonas plecoglossicida TaxID=70775 RepID=UPI0011826195|nr:hypothetical protein [Pseudomonas plecoglossicida]QLB54868.1 hypothetical protein HAV28_08460 [Pseudomonas plecoglossicida]
MSHSTIETRAGQSQPLAFHVRKVIDLVLLVPTIPLAPGNQLPPNDVPGTGLPVYVAAYQGMAIGDMIVMQFGANASSPQRVNALVQQNFIVPKAQVDAYANTSVEVKYLVTRATGGTPVPSPALPLRILPRQVCEDFSGLPVGHRFTDNILNPLPSGAQLEFSTKSMSSSAQIIANGQQRALNFIDFHANPPVVISSLWVHLPKLPTPLARQLTITIRFNVVASKRLTMQLFTMWFIPGSGQHTDTVSVPISASSIVITIPTGAHPQTGTDHFRALFSAHNDHSNDGPSTVNIHSICWEA